MQGLWDQKSNLPELEVQKGVSCHVGARYQTWVLCKRNKCSYLVNLLSVQPISTGQKVTLDLDFVFNSLESVFADAASATTKTLSLWEP